MIKKEHAFDTQYWLSCRCCCCYFLYGMEMFRNFFQIIIVTMAQIHPSILRLVPILWFHLLCSFFSRRYTCNKMIAIYTMYIYVYHDCFVNCVIMVLRFKVDWLVFFKERENHDQLKMFKHDEEEIKLYSHK